MKIKSNVFGAPCFSWKKKKKVFIGSKAGDKKWQWAIILPVASYWLFYVTSTVCMLSIVMNQNGVLLLVHSENNSKRKKTTARVCSIPLMPLIPQ